MLLFLISFISHSLYISAFIPVYIIPHISGYHSLYVGLMTSVSNLVNIDIYQFQVMASFNKTKILLQHCVLMNNYSVCLYMPVLL